MKYRIAFMVAALICMPHLRAGAQAAAGVAENSDQTTSVDSATDLSAAADLGAANIANIPAPPLSLTPNASVLAPQITPTTSNTEPYGPQWPSHLPLPPDAPAAQADLAYLRAEKNWAAWVAKQAPACDTGLDSTADFNPKTNKVAIIIHGLGASPQSMKEVIKLFKAQGFTVLAPRLSGHFETNLKALDRISYQKWVVESEQVFELAKGFGDRITVVGHSLGGLLASRLAIKYPDQVERAVLFAPAWRVRTLVAVASHVGSFFNISLNDQYDIPIACKIDQGYVPASAGKQIQSLIERTENEFGGDPDADTDTPRASIFARMRVPRIVITAPDDEAVDSEMIAAVCPPLKTGCLDISIPNAQHTGITKNLNATSTGKWAHSSIKSILTKFLSLDGRARSVSQAP